jgi:hypothetical protein
MLTQAEVRELCKHIGSFATQEEASAAYLAAAKQIYGEYARA